MRSLALAVRIAVGAVATAGGLGAHWEPKGPSFEETILQLALAGGGAYVGWRLLGRLCRSVAGRRLRLWFPTGMLGVLWLLGLGEGFHSEVMDSPVVAWPMLLLACLSIPALLWAALPVWVAVVPAQAVGVPGWAALLLASAAAWIAWYGLIVVIERLDADMGMVSLHLGSGGSGGSDPEH